jgi:hypothetical protein
MERGLRAKADMYDDWANVPIEGEDKEPILDLKNYEIVDVINLFGENEKGERTIYWTNPKYIKSEE